MPLSISIPTVILFACLTIGFVYLFLREQKNKNKNKYRRKTIRYFIKDGLPIIYMLLATIFGIAAIAILFAGIK